MTQIIQDIAEAVKDRVNAGAYTYAETITAVRKYLPTYEVKDLQTVKVTVVPKAWESEDPLDRSENEELIQLDIGIQRMVDANTDSDIDELMKLVGQIRRQLNRFHPVTSPRAYWMRTSNVPVYDQAFLRDRQMFISLITATYSVTQ